MNVDSPFGSDSLDRPVRRPACRTVLSVIFCLALASLSGCGAGPPADAIAGAKNALAAGDLDTAREILKGLPEDHPHAAEVQMLLGEIAYRDGDLGEALRQFESISRDGSEISVSAASAAAQLSRSFGCLSRTAAALEYYSRHRPGDLQARNQLLEIYLVTGQRRLADLLAIPLAREGTLEFQRLVTLTDDSRSPRDSQLVKQSAHLCPEDPFVNLGLAVEELENGKSAAARTHLEHAVSKAPDNAAAQALLGELLLDASEDEYARWRSRLPDSLRSAPEIWFVLGLHATRTGETDIAARCFWETIRELPNHRRATYQLGLALTAHDPELSAACSRRARDLLQLSEILAGVLNSRGNDPQRIREVIDILMSMGRNIEARAWAVSARQVVKDASEFVELTRRIEADPDWAAARVDRSADLALRINGGRFPSPEVLSDLAERHSSPGMAESASDGIHFDDQAESVGLHFVFDRGAGDQSHGVRMLESTGGGIGVLDYDRDGRPDLLLTQGESWPTGESRPRPTTDLFDRLFRNRGANFADATDAAAVLPDEGYGQGCSAGDFDNDGFPDLYIANIGRNRFLINNGDGTFSDISESLGLFDDAWTSSCLIADLNADGRPDLFDVNYLEGDRLHLIVCDETRCSPDAFAGCPDRLFISNGNGTLLPFPPAEKEPFGKGLGVVAMRVGESPRPDLFVANDHAPNFLLRNSPAENPWNLSLEDVAYPSGLAVDRDGRQTACMGVAAGDLDEDGRIDLFVTNFQGEANNLYLQRPGGLFQDAVTGTGLLNPGLPYVGWGAQFLDADNDGDSDLIVVNGHVADFHSREFESLMPTQFFENLGGVRFRELSPDSVGSDFATKRLGRTLAILDWNQDGLTDAVLLSIDAPTALLTNGTRTTGNSIGLRLVGRSMSRDAIGANVRVTTSWRTRHAQLTGGDGYQCTNERVLRFGLAAGESILRIEIDWPGGATQTIDELGPSREFVIVEGVAPVPVGLMAPSATADRSQEMPTAPQDR